MGVETAQGVGVAKGQTRGGTGVSIGMRWEGGGRSECGGGVIENDVCGGFAINHGVR